MPRRTADDVDAQPPLTPRGRATISDEKGSASLQRGSALARPIARGESYANSPLLPVVGFAFAVTACALNAWAMLPVESSIELEACTDVPTPFSPSSASVAATPSPPGQSSSSVPIPPLMSAAESAVSASAMLSMFKGVDGGGWISPRSDLLYIPKIFWASAKLAIPPTTATTSTTSVSEAAALAAMPPDFSGGGIVLCSGAGAPSSASTGSSSQSSSSAEAPSALPKSVAVASSDNVPIYVGGRCELLTSEAGDKVSTSLFFTQSVLQENDVVTALVPGTTNTTVSALRSEFKGKTVCADAAAAATACAACPGCTILALTDESVDGASDGGTASVSPRAWFVPVAEAKLCRAHQDDRSSFLTLHEALLFVASTASITVGAFALGHFVLFMRHTSREKITEAGNPWLLATLIVQVALVSNPFIVYLLVRFLVKAGFDGSSVNHPPQFSSFEQWLFQVFEFVAVPVGVYVFRAACMYYALDSRRLIGDEEPPAPDGSVKRWLQRWGATTFAHHGATVAYLFRSVLLLMVQWLLTDIRNPPSREMTVPSSGPYSGLNSLTPWLTGPFFSEENFAVVTFTPGSSKSDRVSTTATSMVNGSVGGGGTSEFVHPFSSSFHDVGLPLVVIAIHVNQIVSVLARFAWPLWVGTTTMHTAIARLMAAARATGAPTVGVVSAMVYHGRALALRRLLVFVAAPVIFIDVIMAIIQAAVAPAVWERSLGASKYLMFPQSNLFTPPGLVLLGMGRCLLLWFFFAPAQDDDAAAAERKAARDTLDAENKKRTAGNQQHGSNDRFSAIGPSGRLSRAQGGLRTAGSITASKPAPATSFVGPMLHFAAPIRLTRPSATPAPSAGPSRTVSIQQSAAQNGQARQDGTTRNTDAQVSDRASGDRQGDDDEGDHHHRSSATTQRPADSDGDDIAAHPDTTHDHEPAAVAAVAAVSSTANGAMVEMFRQRLNEGGVENGIDQRNGDALSRSVEDAELRAMFDPVAIASLPRLEHQLDRSRVAQQLLSERDTVEASVLRALHTACSLVDAETPATLASNDAVVLASCHVSESEFLTVFAIDGRGAGSHEEPSDLDDDCAAEQQRDHRPIDDDDDDEAVAQRTAQNDKRSLGSGARTKSKQSGSGQANNLEERPRPAQLPLSILMVRHSHPVVGVTPAITESGDVDAATASVWSTHTSPSRGAATGKAAVRYSPAESTNGTRDHRQPNRAPNAAEHTSIDFEGEGTQGRMDRQSGGAQTSADPLQGFGLLGRPEKAREVDGKVAATARAALHTCADATAICARSTVSVRRQAKQRRAWQRQFAPLTDRNASRSLSSATLSGGSGALGSGALGGKRSHGHTAWTSAVGEAHRALVPTAFAAAVPNSTTQAVVRRLSAHGGHALVNPLAARPEVMSASSDQQMSGFSSAGPSSPARAPVGVAMLPGSIKTPARGAEDEGQSGGVSLETPLHHDGTNHFDGDAGLETSGRSIRSVSGINDADAVQSLTGFRADALSGGTPSVCSSLSPAQASPPKFVIAPEVAVAASTKLQHVYGTVDASVSQIPSEGNRDLSRAAASARFNQSVEVPHISNGNARGLDGGDGRAKAAPLNPSDIIQAAERSRHCSNRTSLSLIRVRSERAV